MKDILIIAHFTQVPGEKGNNRFKYIAERISKEKCSVEVVTSSFSHKYKSQRNMKPQKKESTYKITILYEPSYKKNISFRRFYSHYVFSKNLKKYLTTRRKPDLIYCAVPSLDAAYETAKFSKKHNIKLIIDIQDLWPEAFQLVFNTPLLSDLVYWPMLRKANYIYKSADEVIAVSQSYVDRALSVNKKCNNGYSVYLGTDLSEFDKYASKARVFEKPTNEVWVVYVGTLGHSYDICSVIDAIKIAHNKGFINIKFIVMGDGPLKNKFESYGEAQNINIQFMGRLEYPQMVSILSMCDIAVNPISKNSAASIINKHGDYLASGLPIINTQESSEFRRLLIEYNAGFNCENNDPADLSDKLIKLLLNEELRSEMGRNSRKLAEEKFDRSETYPLILNLIEK